MSRKKNRLTRLLKAAALSAIVISLSSNAFAADVTLKLHQFLPAQSSVPRMLDAWANKIEKASNGRIDIQHFPSMQLGGKPPELVSQVQDGIADIIWTLPGYTPGRFPHTEVFELPFITDDTVAASQAYWELAEEKMMDKDFKDLKVLGLWVHSPGLIHSRKPITDVADLNGVKLRAPSRVTSLLFKSLGATPIGMPVPMVPEALSKGVINAAVMPWEVSSSLKMAELVKNHTEFPGTALYTSTFLLAMNKARYDSLPDDLKKVIDDHSGADFSRSAGQKMVENDVVPRQIAVDAGNNIIELTAAQINEWRKASKSIQQEWASEMDEKGMDGTGLLKQAKKLIEKYSQP